MRTDIQALRGVAVAYVLFYHAGIGGVQAGFLGVDIFFVISGFLITGIVRDAITAGTFSFREFYMRRARRLLPAAYTVLAICAAVSGYFLTDVEHHAFHLQLLGSLVFAVNFVLLGQVDYFAGAADLKPLLHMWSLAIEEQYYLLLPALLFFLRPGLWGPVTLGIVVASLVGCVMLMPVAPASAFYLLPTRAWELGLGSLGALYAARLQGSAWVPRLSLPAVAVLVAVPFFPTGLPHPGLDALLVCVATLVLLLRRQDNRWLPVRALARVGDFSYALYLVHWPMFAFARHVYVSSPVPFEVRAGLLVASVALGYALYRLVEQPMRAREWVLDMRLATRALVVTGALALLPVLSAQLWSGNIDAQQERWPNYGFARSCAQYEAFQSREACRNAPEDQVRILVWGDSFGMHIVPGIVAQHGPGVEQATTEACGPILGLAPRNDTDYTRTWAEFCLDFNRSVMAYIAQSPLETVILSTAITQYVEASTRVLVETASGLEERRGEHRSGDLARMRETVAAIRALGKRVIFISSPPRADYDLPECMVRQATGRLVRGAHADCGLSMENYRAASPQTLEFFRRLEDETDMPVIQLEEFMCQGNGCMTRLDGVMLYRDQLHLSIAGSAKLGKAMDWAQEIRARAR